MSKNQPTDSPSDNGRAMKTFADVKRRLTPGTRLVCEAHHFPEMVGTVRTIVSGKTVLRCTLSYEGGGKGTDDKGFHWDLPKARSVRIIDGDSFEYDLSGNGRGPVRFRFLP